MPLRAVSLRCVPSGGHLSGSPSDLIYRDSYRLKMQRIYAALVPAEVVDLKADRNWAY